MFATTRPYGGTGHDALPVCLGGENPHRLVSLWDIVKEFNAFLVAGQLQAIAGFEHKYGNLRDAAGGGAEVQINEVWTLTNGLVESCRRSGFSDAADKIERIAMRLSVSSSMDVSTLIAKLEDVKDSLITALRDHQFFSVTKDLANYYKHERPCGDKVFNSFPSARFDLTKAGACLACANNVAMTMHLMRASEVGLWELGRDRRIPLAENGKIEFSEGGVIIRELEDAVKAIQQWPNSHTKEEAHKFYNSAVEEIRAFNDGWRRHAAHVRPQPEMHDDEAFALWGHVSRFLQGLALKISEGVYTPLRW